MSQPVSNWAKQMLDEMNLWLAEPDPVTKARLKAAWEQKLSQSAKPPKEKR